MSLRTSTEIKSDLTAARAARLKALNAASSSLDTGQARLSTTRELKTINETIHQLEIELQGALDDESAGGDAGLINVGLERY